MDRQRQAPTAPGFVITPLSEAVARVLRERPAKVLTGVALWLALGGAADAATYVVGNTNDTGPGSLRQAVLDANANPGADLITFASTVSGAITLAAAELSIQDEVEIEGPGPAQLTIDGAGNAAAIVVEDTSATLSGLRITNAASDGVQWALENNEQQLGLRDVVIDECGGSGVAIRGGFRSGHSRFALDGSRISGCAEHGVDIDFDADWSSFVDVEVSESVISGHGGYGLHSQENYALAEARVHIQARDSEIRDNETGIYLRGGYAVLERSVISGNRLSGIYGRSDWSRQYGPESRVVAYDATISGNAGAGITGSIVSFRCEDCTIAGNGLDGIDLGIYQGVGMSLYRCTIDGNARDGIRGEVLARIDDSTISNNARFGISTGGWTSAIWMSNSTVSGNRSSGIVQGAPDLFADLAHVSLVNVTVTGNASGGEGAGIERSVYLDLDMGDTAYLSNVVVAGNGIDLSGSEPFTIDYSLIGEPGTAEIDESVPGSNLIGDDPLLGPLQNNGGSTLTHLPLPGSPLIDAGDPAIADPRAYDQRGPGFDRILLGRIDIGSVEVQPDLQPPATGMAWLRALGDVDADGHPEVAVVYGGSEGGAAATVVDVADDVAIARFPFATGAQPLGVAVQFEADDAYGGPQIEGTQLVVLDEQNKAERRDLPGGASLGVVSFAPSFEGLDLAAISNQDGWGRHALAVLAVGAGPTKVEVRDAATGEPINDVWFAERFSPRQLLALPDLNGNGSAEVGVVLCGGNEINRVALKDTATKDWVQTLTPAWRYRDFNLSQAAVVADRNGNGAPEVAMLLRKTDSGETLVWVADAKTNAPIAAIGGFNPGATPVRLVVLHDLSGDGVEEYALLGRDGTSGQVITEIRDGAQGRLLNRIWMNQACSPLDMVAVDDVNGNNADELVLLGRCGTGGTLVGVVRDALSGEFLRRLDL